jgi:hypothetical protein
MPRPLRLLRPSPPVPLVEAANIATDASQGSHFRVTLTADRTLGAPSNPTDGQRALWEVLASGAARTLTLASVFVFPTGVTGVPQIDSGKTTFIGCIYRASSATWNVVTISGGH